MIVNLSFNGKIYSLTLENIDLWTHQATMTDEAMLNFIIDILKNNSNIKQTILSNKVW